MDISKDGKRLVAIGGLPDFKIAVYNLEEKGDNKLLDATESLMDKDYIKVMFDPFDSKVLFIQSSFTIWIYKYMDTIKKDGNNIAPSCRVEKKKIEAPKEASFIHCNWDAESHLIISTNICKIFLVNHQGNIIQTINTNGSSLCAMVTLRHLIYASDKKMLCWHAPQEPKVEEEIYKHEIEYEFAVEEDIININYNRLYSRIVAVTKSGKVIIHAIDAEQAEGKEEDDKKEGEEKSTVLNIRTVPKGQFHYSKILNLKELNDSTQLATVDESGVLCIWETAEGKLQSRIQLPFIPTCMETDWKGEILIIGSKTGVVHYYDVTNRLMVRRIKATKFFDCEVSQISLVGLQQMISVSSVMDKKIFFAHASYTNDFKVLCHFAAPSEVITHTYITQADKPFIIFLLANNTIGAIPVPSLNKEPSHLSIEGALYRQVDKGMNVIIATPEGDIIATGEDLLFKKYAFPDLPLHQIDLRLPSLAPTEEWNGHGLPATVWSISHDGQTIATGAKNGCVIMRKLTNITPGSEKELKVQNIVYGGVTAMSYSRTRNVLYIGGGDGSFFFYAFYSKTPLNVVTTPELSDISQKYEELESLDETKLELCLKELQNNYEESLKNEKLKHISDVSAEVNGIRRQLTELIEDNTKAPEIERLTPDDFVLDLEKKSEIELSRNNEETKIRNDAEQDILRHELLKKRIKEYTWDTMDTQLKACISLKDSNFKVYNFPLRKPTPDELTKYEKLIRLRRIELKEQLERRKKDITEVLNSNNFIKNDCQYIVNVFPSKPEVVDMNEVAKKKDASKNEVTQIEEEIKVVAEEKKGAKNIMKKFLSHLQMGTMPVKKEEDNSGLDKDKLKEEKKKYEEINWVIKHEKKEVDYYLKNLNNLSCWELLYQPFELSTKSRMKTQMTLLSYASEDIKKEFNDEFENLFKAKLTCIDSIAEKNARISELQKELKIPQELFTPISYLEENPNNVLIVNSSDIKVEKFLSKEEKAKLAEDKRKEEERLKLLQADNVGERGLKDMMDGKLTAKKDIEMLEETVVKEDWMGTKLEEDMTEEERVKFKQYQEKIKELNDKREKQHKAWDLELRKLQSDVNDQINKFDDRLNYMLRKKLYTQVRIFENEALSMSLSYTRYLQSNIRLLKYALYNKSIKNKEDLAETKSRIERLRQLKLSDGPLAEVLARCKASKADLEKEIKKHVKNFKPPETAKRESKDDAYKLNPYYKVEFENSQKIEKPKEEDVINDLIINSKLSEEEARIVFELIQKNDQISMDDSKFKSYEPLINSEIDDCERVFRELENEINANKANEDELNLQESRLRDDITVMLRTKQGYIEVKQTTISGDFSKAVLFKKSVIDKLNAELIAKGNEMITNMEKQFKLEADQETDVHEQKLLKAESDLIQTNIEALHYERVTRDSANSGKDKISPEVEEAKETKRLDTQIKELAQNTEERIKSLQMKRAKIEKDIRDKIRENEELEFKARQLNDNVSQREQILQLDSGTKDDNAQNPRQKFETTAAKRKLLDTMKQQAEEIAVLREELNKIRERTFPSFTHIYGKPEYPDANI